LVLGQGQSKNHQHHHRRRYYDHHQRHQRQLNIQLREFFGQASHLAEQLA
jgi:hypothetical protein